LSDKGVRFVTRLKRDARYTVVERRNVRWKDHVTSDQLIRLEGKKASSLGLVLRRIGYVDPETGKHLVFVTNDLRLAASTIADVYRQRWQIELFFKWIKQNLRIKAFLGRSLNAVLSQLWTAMIVYLLLAFWKFQLRLGWSLTQILRLLQLSLFERRPLETLLQDRASPPEPPDPQISLALA
jgi:putative transposase